MIKRRYILSTGKASIETPAGPLHREIWIGVEIESPIPVDLERFSRELGFDLVPADGLTADELLSVNVQIFHPVVLDGRRVEW